MQTIKSIQVRNKLIQLFILFSLNISGKCTSLHSSLTVSQTVICGPQSTVISLTNTSTGSDAATADYLWYLNGAEFSHTSGLVPPSSATIADIGTYVFMLIGTDKNGCKDTSLANVFIHPIPIANFTTSGTVCTGTTVSFKNISSGTGNFTTYSWDFGDGKKSVELNPTHTYAAVNSYEVTLTISNGGGCMNTYKDTVVLYQSPLAAIEGKDKDGDTKYCLSENDTDNTDTVNFINLSENAQSYRWDFGDGSPLLMTASKAPLVHVYNKYGTFKVTMIAISSQNCEKSTSLTVVFNKAVKATFAIQPTELLGCIPHAIMPANTSVNGEEYEWNFGDATPVITTLNAAPFIHLYKKAGVYRISLKAANSCNSAIVYSDTIRVGAAPVSNFKLDPLIGCAPQLITFKNLAEGSPDNVYHWSFGDGSVWDGKGDPQKKIYQEGKWKVQLTTTNRCGSDSSFQLLSIDAKPQTPSVNEVTVCKGGIALLSVNEPLETIEWFDAAINGKLLGTGPRFTTPALTETTLYFVQNKSGNCISERASVKVSVLPLPDSPVVSGVSICKGNRAALKIQSPGKYEWFDVSSGGACLDTTDSFITPPLFTDTEFYVQQSVGGCKSLRSSVKIKVNDPPKANYKSSMVCLGESTVFEDRSTGSPNSWLWDFGDGNTSQEGPSTTHTYLTSGSFITKLMVSNGIGCHDSVLLVTTVHQPVSAQITAKDSVCIFETLLFKDGSATNADSIIESNWNFGDGSVVENGLALNHIFNKTGNYLIEHTIVSGKGCKSKINSNVYVAPLPVADFTSGNTCQIQKTIFNDQSSTDVTGWHWTFGDSSSSEEKHPQHVYSDGGYFQVTLSVKTSLGCTDTVSHSTFVYRHPVAAFTFDTVCWGDTTTFLNTSQSVDGSIDYVSWNFGDGTTSNEFQPKHVLQTNTDNFLATLTITTNHGCRDTLSQWVKTHPIPKFNFFPTEKTGCAAFTTAFIDSSTVENGKIISWLWDFGDGNLTHKRYPIHTFMKAGNYQVTLELTSSFGCQADRTLPYSIVVLPKPDAAFESVPDEVSIDQPTIQFINSSTNSIMWDWNFGDHKTSVNQNNFHTYTDTGTFIVTLIAISEYGCNDTVSHSIRVNPQPQIYIPNAFSPDEDDVNDVFLPVGNGISVFHMYIFDRWGNKIFYTEELNNGWNGRLNGNGEKVPEGVYAYKIYIKDVLQIPHNYAGSVFVVRK